MTRRTAVTLLGIFAGAAVIVGIAYLAARGVSHDPKTLPTWIESLATLAAVGAVGAAWIQLADGRQAARHQAEQAAQAAIDAARPYVLLSAEPSRHALSFFDLVVENVGAGPAYDVSIVVDPPLKRAQEIEGEVLAEARLFKRPIEMLPPHFKLRSWLDSAIERAGRTDLPDVHRVTIRYSDGRGHVWTEDSTLDFTIPNGLLFTEEYTVHHAAKALREIEKHLKRSRLLKGEVETVVEGRTERRERIATDLAKPQTRHQGLVEGLQEESTDPDDNGPS
jgi:hypothetical protein